MSIPFAIPDTCRQSSLCHGMIGGGWKCLCVPADAIPANFRAFPSAAIDPAFGGMSLRDHFAGQAMAAWISTWSFEAEHPVVVRGLREEVAGLSYDMADAMMAERARPPIMGMAGAPKPVEGSAAPAPKPPFVAPKPESHETIGTYNERVIKALEDWING